MPRDEDGGFEATQRDAAPPLGRETSSNGAADEGPTLRDDPSAPMGVPPEETGAYGVTGNGTTGAGRAGSPGARPPQFLGDYELLDEIARGGMGVVYRASQAHLGRIVALKLVRDPNLASYSEIRRFRAEAEAVAQLDHSNIVPIYQVGQTDDQPYFSMKLIEGGNLSRHVDRLKSDPRAVALLMVKVARAVYYAHQRAILHRDIKPSNILLDEHDEPYVTDFGLAKRIAPGDASAQTVTGAVMGTPAYMPPEQARGGIKSLTTAADVYGLGATLYELVTGRPPFAADSVAEVLRAVLEKEPARPRGLNPALDRDLETICLKCLEKEPGRRYGSAEALADDLERWLDGHPIAARPASAGERLAKWARRRPEIAGLTAAVLAAVATGMIGVVYQWRKAESNLASLRRSLYDADMKLGEQALANSQYPRVEALVRAHGPKGPSGPDDLRGFEWHYLRAAADPEPMTLRADDRSVEDIRFSPDGTLLATLGVSRVIRLWDVATGRLVRALDGHSNYVRCIAFHPSGAWLASGGIDRVVWLWEVATGKLVRTYQASTSIRGLAFSDDGRRLAAGCDDPRVVVFDVETGAIAMRSNLPRTSRSPLFGNIPLVFNHAGTRLLVGHYSERTGLSSGPSLLDAATGESVRRLEGGMGIFSRDDRTVRQYTLQGGWQTRDAETGKVLDESAPAVQQRLYAPGLRDGYQAPVMDSRERLLFLPTGAGAVIFNARFRHVLRTLSLEHPFPVGADMILTLAPPDDRIVAMNAGLGKVVVWYNPLLREAAEVRVGTARLTGLALDPAGRVLTAVAQDGAVTQVDFPARRVVRRLAEAEGPVYSVASSQDGRTVGAAGADGRVYLRNQTDGGPVRTLSLGRGQALAVAFDPTGRRVAAGGDHRRLRVWDAATGRVLLDVPEEREGPILGVAFSPDGRTLATAGGDQTVRLRDAATGRLQRTLRRDPTTTVDGPFFNVAFSPDGRRVVAACAGGVAVVWGAPGGALELTLAGHIGPVHHATFSPDGRRVVTAGADGAVKLWDAVLGTETFELRHGSPLSATAMTRDGLQLVTAGWDGRLTIWDATPVTRVPGRGAVRAGE